MPLKNEYHKQASWYFGIAYYFIPYSCGRESGAFSITGDVTLARTRVLLRQMVKRTRII